MNDGHPKDQGSSAAPIPRDPPDQQARADEDPLDVVGGAKRRTAGERPDLEIPDTDEAGTGRRGAPHAGHHPHPEHPVPDEPSG
ncbi:hypothetical protein EDD93_6857 [Streptomyces sp. 840.1]|uniref:hypothetical protein n=1 Tax=Streptomyces sp. 840.1 TaxID=2485152 RepID=UPI000F48D3FE|nr:hypothetical protein [Streptomyces sp. 840.1]ROQ59462.1 hypothetical protein EDD93_6857 [Streptomyces sp. 840.1]